MDPTPLNVGFVILLKTNLMWKFPFSEISSSWYRDITTDPIWEGLAGCVNASDQRSAGPWPCNGFLPLQWATKGAWCGKNLNKCADRSDEGNCTGKRHERASTASLQENVFYPPVAEYDARQIKYCAHGINHTERVSINGSCIEISSICEGNMLRDIMVRTKIFRAKSWIRHNSLFD